MNQAPPDRIYQVNLLGTVNVIEVFYEVATAGTSLVAISSAAGHSVQGSLAAELEQHLAAAPVESLLKHPDLISGPFDPKTNEEAQRLRMGAYAVAKRGNFLRVQASAVSWARKGAHINSVSPGVVLSTMCQEELDGPGGAAIREAIGQTPAGRIGTTADIAHAVAFLCSKEAAFMTGSNMLVDGGLTAMKRWGLDSASESKM